MRRLRQPSPECVGKLYAIVIITAIALSPLPNAPAVILTGMMGMLVEYLGDRH